MRWIALLLLSGVLLAAACGDDDNATDQDSTPTQTVEATDTQPPPTDTPVPPEPTDTQPPPATDTPPPSTGTPVDGGTTNGDNCHPSYQGACLAQGVGDWDCTRAGGGDGPNYVEDVTSGSVRVVGPDDFRLDRDGDGIGCE